MKARITRWGALALASGVLSCVDTPTRLDSPTEPHFSVGSKKLRVLRRTEPLRRRQTVTRLIGPQGGVLELPEAGLRVEFPPHALAASIAITVTAPPGKLVRYEFSPHGTQFQKGVRVEVSLRGTEAEPEGAAQKAEMEELHAGYYAHSGQIDADGLAAVDELLPTYGQAAAWTAFEIRHFSGYILVSGLTEKGDDK
ncbi:MAG: hypothetical protein HY561_09355 [Gemmatimonadetes bacterium]|nr:hypothetical protein [Gemmatimonadota bacterium]